MPRYLVSLLVLWSLLACSQAITQTTPSDETGAAGFDLDGLGGVLIASNTIQGDYVYLYHDSGDWYIQIIGQNYNNIAIAWGGTSGDVDVWEITFERDSDTGQPDSNGVSVNDIQMGSDGLLTDDVNDEDDISNLEYLPRNNELIIKFNNAVGVADTDYDTSDLDVSVYVIAQSSTISTNTDISGQFGDAVPLDDFSNNDPGEIGSVATTSNSGLLRFDFDTFVQFGSKSGGINIEFVVTSYTSNQHLIIGLGETNTSPLLDLVSIYRSGLAVVVADGEGVAGTEEEDEGKIDNPEPQGIKILGWDLTTDDKIVVRFRKTFTGSNPLNEDAASPPDGDDINITFLSLATYTTQIEDETPIIEATETKQLYDNDGARTDETNDVVGADEIDIDNTYTLKRLGVHANLYYKYLTGSEDAATDAANAGAADHIEIILEVFRPDRWFGLAVFLSAGVYDFHSFEISDFRLIEFDSSTDVEDDDDNEFTTDEANQDIIVIAYQYTDQYTLVRYQTPLAANDGGVDWEITDASDVVIDGYLLYGNEPEFDDDDNENLDFTSGGNANYREFQDLDLSFGGDSDDDDTTVGSIGAASGSGFIRLGVSMNAYYIYVDDDGDPVDEEEDATTIHIVFECYETSATWFALGLSINGFNYDFAIVEVINNNLSLRDFNGALNAVPEVDANSLELLGFRKGSSKYVVKFSRPLSATNTNLDAKIDITAEVNPGYILTAAAYGTGDVSFADAAADTTVVVQPETKIWAFGDSSTVTDEVNEPAGDIDFNGYGMLNITNNFYVYYQYLKSDGNSAGEDDEPERIVLAIRINNTEDPINFGAFAFRVAVNSDLFDMHAFERSGTQIRIYDGYGPVEDDEAFSYDETSDEEEGLTLIGFQYTDELMIVKYSRNIINEDDDDDFDIDPSSSNGEVEIAGFYADDVPDLDDDDDNDLSSTTKVGPVERAFSLVPEEIYVENPDFSSVTDLTSLFMEGGPYYSFSEYSDLSSFLIDPDHETLVSLGSYFDTKYSPVVQSCILGVLTMLIVTLMI